MIEVYLLNTLMALAFSTVPLLLVLLLGVVIFQKKIPQPFRRFVIGGLSIVIALTVIFTVFASSKQPKYRPGDVIVAPIERDTDATIQNDAPQTETYEQRLERSREIFGQGNIPSNEE